MKDTRAHTSTKQLTRHRCNTWGQIKNHAN